MSEVNYNDRDLRLYKIRTRSQIGVFYKSFYEFLKLHHPDTLDKVFPLARKNYTNEELKTIARTFSSKKDFVRDEPLAYMAAFRKGVLEFEKLCSHMDNGKFLEALKRRKKLYDISDDIVPIYVGKYRRIFRCQVMRDFKEWYETGNTQKLKKYQLTGYLNLQKHWKNYPELKVNVKLIRNKYLKGNELPLIRR